MVKIIILSIVGFGLTGASLFTAFLYLFKQSDQINSTSLLFATIVLFVCGVACIVFTKKSIDAFMRGTNLSADALQQETSKPQQSILERNNQIITQWSKTSSLKDKLKMLQISAQAKATEETPS